MFLRTMTGFEVYVLYIQYGGGNYEEPTRSPFTKLGINISTCTKGRKCQSKPSRAKLVNTLLTLVLMYQPRTSLFFSSDDFLALIMMLAYLPRLDMSGRLKQLNFDALYL